MFALKAKTKGSNASAPHGVLRDELRVLPKLMRRPVRFFQRLLQGDIALPRHIEGFGIAVIIGGAVVYGSVVGGQFANAVETVTVQTGFGVSEIQIVGNEYTTPSDIYNALGLGVKRSLISIDPAEARLALRKLPWVDAARIAKVYPNKLEIEIGERDAFAIWQQGEALTVVEKDGTVIGGYAGDARLAALPLLVGKGATEEGAEFVQTVAQFKEIAPRVRAYIRVGTRRWNLRLENGMTIRLPEIGVEHALERLVALEADLGVMERDLAAIDLRLEDRTVFALTNNAMMNRDEFVKARSDADKKQRKARGSRI